MTDTLITDPRLARPDDLYNALIEAHRDLAPEESERLNAKLVLLLANHIGSLEVVEQALALARNEDRRAESG